MNVALLDDQALGSYLRGTVPPELRRRTLATTGYWYVRLCQAVLKASGRPGMLSGPFTGLPDEQRTSALAALLQLPTNVELLSLRRLGPVIGRLRVRHSLNILGMEVLAAAVTLDADVFLSVPSPKLESSLALEARRSIHLS